jgi:riboflavin biosynthesis pyrimidine reductase
MSADDVIYMFAMSLDGFIARPDGMFSRYTVRKPA